jgi:2-polyprenyl-3-methyl-5-hydroxy-6-metoxy-1,4-benzoquinol methylase
VHAVAGAKDTRLSVGRGYDAIAAAYDAQVQGDDWMRQKLHAHYARVFRPGQRVLDVGCGTGIDAEFLARRGVSVLGIDTSTEMLAQLRTRIAASGLEQRIECRDMLIEELSALGDKPPFDGLISAFASLSTVSHLMPFARDAARLVRPGGRMILHMLNRFSLWELVGYVAHGDLVAAERVGREARRNFTIGGHTVRHSMHFAEDLYRRYFVAAFRLRERYSLGAIRPPHTLHRLPAPLVARLERLDLATGGWPLLRDAGRFFVLDLERRTTP